MTVYLLLGDDEERKSRGVEKLRAEGRSRHTTPRRPVRNARLGLQLLLPIREGPFVVLKNLDAWNAAQKAVIVDYLGTLRQDQT